MGKALILIDIQNDYFENGTAPVNGAYEAVMNTKAILEKFRAEELPIVHIQHQSVRSGSTFFIPDTYGCKIHEIVTPFGSEKVITKHFPNSFCDTVLLDYLKDLKITDLVICGMMTHMCVDATVRAAKDLGFNCTVIGDACATKDLEFNGIKTVASDVHNAFLSALNYFYSNVKTTKQYLGEKSN